MAITVPAMNGPSVRSQPIGTPQVRAQPVDNSMLELGQQAVNTAGQIWQKSQDDADTAALIAAESKLSDWKLNTMFNPESGVYNKKGGNALDVTNQTVAQFDEQAATIGGQLTNERQRARFNQITANQRSSLGSELNRYEFGERQRFYEETDKASLQSATAGATAYYQDPEQVAYYQSKGARVIVANGQRQGLPAAAIEQNVQDFNSGVATSVIERMMLDNPTKSAEYFASVQGYMTPQDTAKVAKALRPSLSRQYASDLFTAVSNGKSGAAQFWNAQIGAESGGRQTDSKGQPLTSPAGAIGIAQVMPDTGPEAAKLAGLPWDEERFKTDADYNAQLGKAYSSMLFKRYDNDAPLALAAYNAGMGNVDKAIAKAGDPRKTGDYSAFINALPKPEETGPYVEKIIAASTPRKADQYAQMLEIGQSIPDQTTRKYYEADVQDWKKAEDAKGVARYETASEIVGSQGLANVPPQMLVDIPGDEIKKLEEQDRRRREGVEPVTDVNKLEEFIRMPPAQLASKSLERDIRPYLNNSDFSRIQKSFTSALKGDGTTQAAQAAEYKATASVMNLAGIKFGDSVAAQSEQNQKNRAQFENSYNQLRDAFVKKNGADPTPQEAQKIAEQLLVEVRMSGTGMFSDSLIPAWQVKAGEGTKAFIDPADIKIDDLTPNERQQAVERLNTMGVQKVTDETISEAYLQILEARGLKVKR
jgi:soluble lytic murein transglycosylase